MRFWSQRLPGRFTLAVEARRPFAESRDSIRTLVRGIRQGFGLLTRAGVVIAPRTLRFLVGLPPILSHCYLRRVLARPASELIMARHANAVPDDMLVLVEELRAIVRLNPG